MNILPSSRRGACAALALLLALPLAAQQRGTTLIGGKTAEGTRTRTYHWTIEKGVTPGRWDLFHGDDADSSYTVAVTRDEGSDSAGVRGAVTVTNGGDYPTENLAILDCIQSKIDSGPYTDLLCSAVDLSAMPVLGPGAAFTYAYEIPFTPVDGALYRNVARITITNHAGWIPGGTNCPGPAPCPFGPEPKADFSVPADPNIFINASVNVDDTNGMTWFTDASASWTYERNFSCPGGGGDHLNTATIRETGQSDDALVTIGCHQLSVLKTAETAYTRAYDWTIEKTVNPAVLTLPGAAQADVAYMVTASRLAASDRDWTVTGRIRVSNAIDNAQTAEILRLSDLVTPGDIAGLVSCDTLFPAFIAPGDALECTYRARLPDASDRFNTATAEMRNHHFDPDGSATPTGSSSVSSAPVLVRFGGPTTIEDDTASAVDSLACPAEFTCTPGAFGPWSYDDNGTSAFVTTVVNVSALCDSHYLLVNSATLTETTTGTVRGPATATTDIYTDACPGGCTLTIGYWKTHAGFTGNNADRITEHLPIWLGIPSDLGAAAPGAGSPPVLPKSVQVMTAGQARDILSMQLGDPSNGITKLYAQLLAAKLNIARGADPGDVLDVITAADAFLRYHNEYDWQRLTRAGRLQVLQWMTALDAYNNGLVGPGHCN